MSGFSCFTIPFNIPRGKTINHGKNEKMNIINCQKILKIFFQILKINILTLDKNHVYNKINLLLSENYFKRKRTSPDTEARSWDENRKLMSSVPTTSSLQQPEQAPDDIQTFANYLVSDLRKIKSDEYRESVQRQLLKLAWNLIDQQPVIMLHTLEIRNTFYNVFVFSLSQRE